MLDQNRDVVPYPAGIEQSVLLVNYVFDVLAWDRGVLIDESVHNMGQCPQFFSDSHSPIVSSRR
ncbi:hypothetical protein NG819_02935 [Pseudarthrobacter sp. Fe7]|nr:hypothetical protein NG819_02935 [Pseudarthrobacter sp. Fe7]